jgi:hypothetical protein
MQVAISPSCRSLEIGMPGRVFVCVRVYVCVCEMLYMLYVSVCLCIPACMCVRDHAVSVTN